MAKKPERTKQERYDESFVRGKRALLIGIFPIFIFLGLMVFGAWVILDYYNKTTINEDVSDTCKLVRKHNPASIKSTNPCTTVDKGDYILATFNMNTGANEAPVYMSFKVSKSDNSISPATDLR